LAGLLADVGGRGDTRAMRQYSGSYSGRVGTDSPFWVPGEAEREVRERLEEGVTSFTVTRRREPAPLLEVSAGLIAAGGWETCGACLAEGLAARGELFAAFAEHVTSPAWLSWVDSPHWVPFVAHWQMYADICGTVPYSPGAHDALADELLEREK
jgi:hypothetical protein